MFIVRQAQLDAMGSVLRERFTRAAAAHLRTTFPDRCSELGEAGITTVIEQAMAKGGAHGIEAEQDVACLAHFMMATANDFDVRPDYAWATEILRAADLTGTEKIDALFHALAERQRDAGTGE